MPNPSADPFNVFRTAPDNFKPGFVPPIDDILAAERHVQETLHNVLEAIDQFDVSAKGKKASREQGLTALGQGQVIKNAAAEYRCAKARLAQLRRA